MSSTMVIEASSPLAAMQHPMYMPRCGFGQEYKGTFAAPRYGQELFNFKELSMFGAQKQKMDYFNMPAPVRGSSPTATLAADLSQNMTIDRSSPSFPTPRRHLFGNNVFGLQQLLVTTPPISSSSPNHMIDGMEMSPLPHKPSHALDIRVRSPTPEPSLADNIFSDESTPRQSSPPRVQELSLQIPDRRKPGQARPGLSRSKGYSTTSIPTRVNPEAQPPRFQFTTGIPRSQSSDLRPHSTSTLQEIFECSSPIAGRDVIEASPLPVRPPISRPPFNFKPHNASPIAQHTRKISAPAARPRKQFRRCNSMFESPGEVMRSTSAPQLQSVNDMAQPHAPTLPHFYKDSPTDMPRISRETMIKVLDGEYDYRFSRRVVVDCRFEYEFNGGHIEGAVNFNDKDLLTGQLFDHEIPANALLIFHCEYSAHRAPLMAKHVRNKDRDFNRECYPKLCYPESYILDGGFSNFFRDHPNRCIGGYVEMDSKDHVNACEAGMDKVKHQQRAKLQRAQTFAFGQQASSSGLDSSPSTAFRRHKTDVDMDMGNNEFTPVAPRPNFAVMQFGRQQRMFSY